MTRETSDTPRRGYGRPALGSDWAADWDTLVEDLDETVVARGPIADRPASGEYDDELYLATDEQTLYRWDGTSWVTAISGGGAQFEYIQTFGSESDLPSTNANGEIPLDPDTLWVLDSQTSNQPVSISSPIISTDTSKVLTITSFTGDTLTPEPNVVPPAIVHTASNYLCSQSDIKISISGVGIFSQGAGVLNVSGNGAFVNLRNEAVLGVSVISDGVFVCEQARVGDITFSAIQSAAIKNSTVSGNISLANSVNQFQLTNSYIFGGVEIDNQGSVSNLVLSNLSGHPPNLTNISNSISGHTVTSVFGIREDRYFIEVERITEEVTPANTGDSVSPSDNTESFIVNPDGDNTVDLSGSGREGRELSIVHNGGSNTPIVSFDSADFAASGPSNLTANGSTTTIQYLSGVWKVMGEYDAS